MSARKAHDLAFISANGFIPVSTYDIGDLEVSFDVIFNTVPSMIFGKEVLYKLKGAPVIIELASKPYGADLKRDAQKVRNAKKQRKQNKK